MWKTNAVSTNTRVQANHVIVVIGQVHTRNTGYPIAALVWPLYADPCMVVKQSGGYFAELCIICIIISHMAQPGWGFLMRLSLDTVNSFTQHPPLHAWHLITALSKSNNSAQQKKKIRMVVRSLVPYGRCLCIIICSESMTNPNMWWQAVY